MSTACDDDVLLHVAHRPDHLIGFMITVDKPAKPSALRRRSGPSSLGLLDPLSLEILHNALNLLDFQSLSRLSRVSRKGRVTVESLPAYRDLMTYAPDTLKALGQSNLLRHHSADKLHAVLRSKACVACERFGPFLFLPTCERCCYMCLEYNHSFWVIPIPRAQTIYSLEARQLKKLAVMKGIPGVYKEQNISKSWRPKLVSVLAVVQLARANGTMPIVDKSIITPEMREWDRMPSWMTCDYYAAIKALEPPLEPLTGHPSWLLPEDGLEREPDEFSGMASIQFPCLLPDNTLEHGLWCKGCEWMLVQFKAGELPTQGEEDRAEGTSFSNRSMRAMSKSEFLTHTRKCYGAGQILSALDN
ncbi:hypothetical protein MauCBS54593_001609 [Microsporum audouinii]